MGRFIMVGAVVAGLLVGGYALLKHRQREARILSLAAQERNGWQIFLHDGRIWYLRLDDRSIRLVNTQPTSSPQSVGAASISPDGHQIVFAESLDGKYYSLISFDMVVRKRLELVKLPFLDNPSWSPAGDMIAFDGRDTNNDGPSNLYIYDIRRGVASTIIEHGVQGGFPLCWVAEGKVVYQGADDNIELVDLKTGHSRFVHKGQFPSCSPDGRVIRYEANNGYMLHDLESNQETSILQDGSVSRNLIWSPDGRYLVYSRLSAGWWQRLTGALSATDVYGDLYVMDVQSKAETMIYRRAASIYVSDWKHVAPEAL